MSDLVSRVLGPIVLRGALGGNSFESTTQLRGQTIPVTLEIDSPGKLDHEMVELVDVVLENFDRVQPMFDDVFTRGLRDSTSSLSRLYQAWQASESAAQERTEADFLANVVPLRLRFSPDIDVPDADRMAIAYGVGGAPFLGEVTVRFIDRFGPEPAPSCGSGRRQT